LLEGKGQKKKLQGSGVRCKKGEKVQVKKHSSYRNSKKKEKVDLRRLEKKRAVKSVGVLEVKKDCSEITGRGLSLEQQKGE